MVQATEGQRRADLDGGWKRAKATTHVSFGAPQASAIQSPSQPEPQPEPERGTESVDDCGCWQKYKNFILSISGRQKTNLEGSSTQAEARAAAAPKAPEPLNSSGQLLPVCLASYLDSYASQCACVLHVSHQNRLFDFEENKSSTWMASQSRCSINHGHCRAPVSPISGEMMLAAVHCALSRCHFTHAARLFGQITMVADDDEESGYTTAPSHEPFQSEARNTD